jgi:hypothetical protein
MTIHSPDLPVLIGSNKLLMFVSLEALSTFTLKSLDNTLSSDFILHIKLN